MEINMKLSKKQKEEIDFFSSFAKNPFIPTETEIENYINQTVYGKKENALFAWSSSNRISVSKRQFDISIKMWIDDLSSGLLSIDELYEEYGQHPFGKKLVHSVQKALNKPNTQYLFNQDTQTAKGIAGIIIKNFQVWK